MDGDLYSTVVAGKLRLKKPKKGKRPPKEASISEAPVAAAALVAGAPASGESVGAPAPSSARAARPARADAAARESDELAAPARKPRRRKRRADDGHDADGAAKRPKAPELTESDEEALATVPDLAGFTPAQRRLEALRIKQERMFNKDRVEHSHRERMEELNGKLEKLPMHFDVPKVAAAGLG
ncbi:hypothetical protein FNF29_01661 [Cafeteria roenbergensis]|uniref:Uncharacterized protein n=1 Tax=Cafeteria roenbergensis TaxID=33653 RepID=A0A5A8CRV1_CAFRO|nr:hypothetical protein FNF31_07391 [Cafeteria roenbergensis]KAA0155746.1 hypothetical protein FNF29_01661 [Cafeteria roenbergensis]KAA0171289.1 hypothetical protein FNF28_00780 [Cafeteria roenbergensis]|eukprot:KAA0155746.1 hypothetical protein FNF29_01661 [Cafeteria roenbergensis]